MKEVVAVLAVVAVAALLLLAMQQGLRALWLLARGQDLAAVREGDREIATLRDDLDRALRSLAEIQFDHATGKIDDADSTIMRQRYEARAVQAMRALRARGVDVQAERADA